MEKLFNVSLTKRAQDSPHVQAVRPPDLRTTEALGPRSLAQRESRHMVSCLLIDRNAGERLKLSDIMAELGFDCIALPETADGIRYCQTHRPDVVVMSAAAADDARDFLRFAPGADGRDGRPVVIFYADKPDVETMGEAIREGAAEFLLKPFDRDLLKFKLRQSGVMPTRMN